MVEGEIAGLPQGQIKDWGTPTGRTHGTQQFSALPLNTGEPRMLTGFGLDYFFSWGFQDGRLSLWVCLRSAEGGEPHTVRHQNKYSWREYLQDLPLL